MKKMFNKILSSLLICSILVCSLSFVSLAEKAAENQVILGDGGSYGGIGINVAQVGGIGGKSPDDMACAFVLGADEATYYRRYQYDVSQYVPGTDEYTYEFNMYADGNAEAWVCYGSGYSLIRWDADGTIWYDKDGTMTQWGRLSRGQWHRIAISYRIGYRFVYYIDGVLVCDTSRYTSAPSIIGFGYAEGSSDGTVAFDDMIKYDELYTNHYKEPYYTLPKISVSRAAKLGDNNVINYDDELITSSDMLLDCISIDETDTLRMYMDSHLVTQIKKDTPLTGSEYIVVESSDKAYTYYSVSGGYKMPVAELSSTNPRVVVDGGCVYVYSHPCNLSYKIDSDTLINSLTSKTHSSITYLNTDYEEVSVNDVYDGYIKLVDTNGNTAFFEIKPNTGNIFEEFFTLSDFSSNGYYHMFDESSKVTYSISEAGIQKDNNDTSFAIHGNGETNIHPSGARYPAWLQKNNPDITLNTVYTIEYSFLNMSSATSYSSVIWKKANGSNISNENLFSMTSNGTAYSYNNAEIGKLCTDEWHTVNITYDYTRARVLVYVDGVPVSEDVWIGADGGAIDYIKFGMSGEGDDAPAYGTIYYDDICIYGGYPRGDKHTPSLLSDKFYIDRASKTIYGAAGRASEEVLNNLVSELNGTVMVDSDTITTDAALTQVVSGIDGLQYTYEYTFSDKNYISSPAITNTGSGVEDEINARITVCPAYDDSFDKLNFMLAAYNGDKLTGLQLLPDNVVSKEIFDISLSQSREDNIITKLFLWDNTLTPIYGDDVTSQINRPTMMKSDAEYKEMLSDFIAVHSRSGLITAYGQKHFLQSKPYISDSVVYIPLKETAELLGVSAEAASSSDGYISAKQFFEEIMNLTVTELNAKYNSGVIIAGDTKFDVWSVADTQALNDYLFNYRPSADEILKMYNSSSLKGQHPRIYVSASDVERIKRECETNSYMAKWRDTIIKACNWISTLPIVEYKIDEGGRLLGVSRNVLSYMHTYGMAYLLTGDASYAQKAFMHLQAAANFPDWNPDHALDTGEMAAAFAVGYDWMYNGFTEDQRRIIEDGFCRHGIAAANNLYEGVAGRTSSVVCDINWNAVVNGGLATGAFAFMDVYPQNSSAIVSNALRGYDRLLWRFAPCGAWFEGPGYWEYTIKYVTKMLSNSERILGTEFGLTRCEGFDTTVDYILHMQSLNGTYAYGDCMTSSVLYVPEIFWLSYILDKPEYTSTLLQIKNGSFSDYEDIALALCWYDTAIQTNDAYMNLDAWIGGEEVVAMRSGWTADDSYFAACAGLTGENHCHLDSGSYIFDLNGVRWAHDLGQGNYNNRTYRYSDSSVGGERWKIFRLRAEAHNTLFINPTTNEDHKIGSFAAVERFETNDTSGIAVIDMTEALSDNVQSAKRAFAYCDNRSSIIIRDEIELLDKSKSNDVYWVMMTKADVEILPDGSGAILTQNSQTLYLDFVQCGADTIDITVAPAAPIDTTGVVISESGDDLYNRILIKLTSSDRIDLTVSLSDDVNPQLLTDYNTAISNWVLE